MQENARAPVDVGSALLAQLVARGSDKAKVIGSSPVESNSFIPLFLFCWDRTFGFEGQKQNPIAALFFPLHLSVVLVFFLTERISLYFV